MPPVGQSAPKSYDISPLGVTLFAIALLAFLTAGMSSASWVKRLDQPPPGTYRFAAGQEGSLFLKLSQKSIKGLHHTNAVRGHIDLPGESAPRPLLVRDSTSTDWEEKIKIPQFLSAAPSVEAIESNVVLLLATQMPNDPALIGRTVPVTFDLDMTIPRVNPQNLKTGLLESVRDSWTVQVQIMPPGYTRIYQWVCHISLAVAGVALVLGFLRILLQKRFTRVKPLRS